MEKEPEIEKKPTLKCEKPVLVDLASKQASGQEQICVGVLCTSIDLARFCLSGGPEDMLYPVCKAYLISPELI